MIVTDASAVVDVLLSAADRPQLAARMRDDDLAAPHLLDIEVLHALRRHNARSLISAERAGAALAAFAEVPFDRWSHERLRPRIWELRHNLTAYDAAYVALSEMLDAPLITTDARLAHSAGHRATIELYE